MEDGERGAAIIHLDVPSSRFPPRLALFGVLGG